MYVQLLGYNIKVQNSMYALESYSKTELNSRLDLYINECKVYTCAASVDDSKEMRQLSQYDHTQQQV
jgi:hypothetical protein